MLKNEKGITILILVITIVIMIIITGVSVNNGFLVVKEVRLGRIISNMTMVKAKAETIYEQNQFNQTPLVGTQSTITTGLSQKEKEMLGEDIALWEWYKWDAETLKTQGLDPEMLRADEYYLVNYQHAEIVYSKGASLDKETTYYSLTGLKHTLEND